MYDKDIPNIQCESRTFEIFENIIISFTYLFSIESFIKDSDLLITNKSPYDSYHLQARN